MVEVRLLRVCRGRIGFHLGRWWEAMVTRLVLLLYGPWMMSRRLIHTLVVGKFQEDPQEVIFIFIDCPKRAVDHFCTEKHQINQG